MSEGTYNERTNRQSVSCEGFLIDKFITINVSVYIYVYIYILRLL